MAADRRQVTLLCLLDVSSAFDYVDHDLLLQRLRLGFGLTDAVLEWIRTFLSDRTQQIAYGQLAATQPLPFGVPRGFVLGPLLYVLYTAELGQSWPINMVLVFISTPTTVKYTSAFLSVMQQRPYRESLTSLKR